MTTFVLAYRAPEKRLDEMLAALDDEGRTAGLGAWRDWFETMGSSLVDQGNPVNDARTLGNCGPGTRIGGYSIISADDIDAAVEIARGCPSLERDGGVEVGEVLELSLDPGSPNAAR
jgi:YCII-related domain